MVSNSRQHLAEFYSHTGRPSIDPEWRMMMRMSIIGYPVLSAKVQ